MSDPDKTKEQPKQSQPQESDDDRPITRKEFTEMFSTAFNGAWSTREKRATKKADEPPAGQSDGAPQDRRYTELERQVKELKEANAKEKEAAAFLKAESLFREKATGAVRGESMSPFLRLLKADGVLAVGDDGTPVIRVREGGLDPVDHPVERGLKLLSKHQDYAGFFAPPTQGGSGASSARAVSGNDAAYRSKPRHLWTQAEIDDDFQRNFSAAEEAARSRKE